MSRCKNKIDTNDAIIVVLLPKACYISGTVLETSRTLSRCSLRKSYGDPPILQILTEINFSDQAGWTSDPTQFKLQKVSDISVDNAA